MKYAMIFIETEIFSRYIHDYMDDAELTAFQWYLVQNPKAGDVIKNSGGLRKIRWSGKGRGKRGGTRIIYFHKTKEGEIWLLTVYSKNEVEDLTAKQLKLLQEAIKK